MDGGEALGERLARSDETALEEAYRTYAPSVLSYLRRYLRADEAEDALQRVFIDVWTGASRFRPGARFSSWLFTIAQRRAIDVLRRRRHDLVDVDVLRGMVGEDGREQVERFADAADVRAALATLPEHEREVLLLAYFVGLSQSEIALRLDAPLGTVKARAARGTRRLREVMRGSEHLMPGGAHE